MPSSAENPCENGNCKLALDCCSIKRTSMKSRTLDGSRVFLQFSM